MDSIMDGFKAHVKVKKFNHGGLGELGDKKCKRWLSSFKSLVFRFLCLSIASAVPDRRYKYQLPVTRHPLPLTLPPPILSILLILSKNPLLFFLQILSSCLKIPARLPPAVIDRRYRYQLLATRYRFLSSPNFINSVNSV